MFFLILVVGELIYISGISVNERDAYSFSKLSQKTDYNDYSVDAVKYIKQHDNSFYRIDKTYSSVFNTEGIFRSLDDGMIQDYYGTSSYSSFNQKYYIYYLELMGVINNTDEFSTRWADGLSPYHILEAENSVKYVLTHALNRHSDMFICFDSLTQIGDVKILRNRFALPLGYTYNYYMRKNSFNSLSFIQKNYVSIRTCVIEDQDVNKVSDLKEYHGNISSFNWIVDIHALKKDTLTINHFSENFIEGTINVDEDEMMYLSIPYDSGWKLKVDKQPTDKIILNGGMSGVMLKKGYHTLELKYDLPFINIGLILSLLGIFVYLGLWLYTRQKPMRLQ